LGLNTDEDTDALKSCGRAWMEPSYSCSLGLESCSVEHFTTVIWSFSPGYGEAVKIGQSAFDDASRFCILVRAFQKDVNEVRGIFFYRRNRAG